MTFEEEAQAALKISFPDMVMISKAFKAQEHSYTNRVDEVVYGIEINRKWLEAACEVFAFTARLLESDKLKGIPVCSFLSSYKRFEPRGALFEEPGDTADKLALRLREHHSRFAALVKRAPH